MAHRSPSERLTHLDRPSAVDECAWYSLLGGTNVKP
jgi:hypothetical protein